MTASGRGRAGTLAAICLASFLLIIDVTAVNVALPAIHRTMGADFDELRWVIDSYALALGASVLIFGSLGDRLGRRLVFSLGLTAFAVASAACALAETPTTLIAFRGVQGLGGAGMLATSLALIAVTYPDEDRNRALAMYGASSAAAVAVGPVIGGSFVNAFGWDAIFIINVPTCAVIALLVWRCVAESRFPKATGPIDIPGLLTLAGALVLLVLALFRGNEIGWRSDEIAAMLAGAALLGAAFLTIESRARRPLLDLALYRHPGTTVASVTMFAAAVSVFGMLTFVVFFLQNLLGYDGLETGLRLLPMTAGAFVSSMLASRLLGRVPAAALAGSGLLIAAAGAATAAAQVGPTSDWTAFLIGGVLLGMCHGLVVPSAAQAALGSAPAHQSGMASGLNNSFRLIGMAVGVAAFGAIVERRIDDHLENVLGPVPPGLAHVVATGNIDAATAAAGPDAGDGFATAAREAFIVGFDTILLTGAGVALLGAVVAFTLSRLSRRAVLATPAGAATGTMTSAGTASPSLPDEVSPAPSSPPTTNPDGQLNGTPRAGTVPSAPLFITPPPPTPVASGHLQDLQPDAPRQAYLHAERDPMGTRGRILVWQDPLRTLAGAMHLSGLEYLRRAISGEVAPPPISVTMNMTFRQADFGEVVVDGQPGEEHFNMIGTVSGGYAATLLDSVMATAVLSTIRPGDSFASLTLEVKMVRAITLGTGPVRTHGKVVHRGHSQASAEGTIVSLETGKLLATGTTTCLVTETQPADPSAPSAVNGDRCT